MAAWESTGRECFFIHNGRFRRKYVNEQMTVMWHFQIWAMRHLWKKKSALDGERKRERESLSSVIRKLVLRSNNYVFSALGFFFGTLHWKFHTLWSLQQLGGWLIHRQSNRQAGQINVLLNGVLKHWFVQIGAVRGNTDPQRESTAPKRPANGSHGGSTIFVYSPGRSKATLIIHSLYYTICVIPSPTIPCINYGSDFQLFLSLNQRLWELVSDVFPFLTNFGRENDVLDVIQPVFPSVCPRKMKMKWESQ